MKDIIPDLLGDKDVLGRYIIYQGKDKALKSNEKDVIYTSDWGIEFTKFEELLAKYSNESENV